MAAQPVEEDEARWSRFRPDSDVSRINRLRGPTARSKSTPIRSRCCRRAGTGRPSPGGVFQPLVGTVLERWGYRMSMAEGPPHARSKPSKTARSKERSASQQPAPRPRPHPRRHATSMSPVSRRGGWLSACRTALVRTLSRRSVDPDRCRRRHDARREGNAHRRGRAAQHVTGTLPANPPRPSGFSTSSKEREWPPRAPGAGAGSTATATRPTT